MSGVVVYGLRLDHVVGMYVDDAWYVVLAKALATGRGFTLINAPQSGIMPMYPPAFPALLAFALRLLPHDFETLWLLKFVSLVAMAAVGLLTHHYFRSRRRLSQTAALLLAAASVLSPAFVFLATSTLMSECVFTALQLLVILTADPLVTGSERSRYPRALLAAVLASATFLLRSMALGLLVAVPVWLLMNRRLRLAIVFSLGATACLLPWLLYASSHTPTSEEQAVENDFIVYGYSTHFWHRVAGWPTLGTISAGELPMRIADNALHVLTYDVGALEAYPLYRAIEPTEARRPDGTTAAVSLMLGAITLAGFVAVGRHAMTLAEWVVLLSVLIPLAWPFWPFRFLLPLLPFVLFYLGVGSRQLGALFRPRRGAGQPALGAMGLVAISAIVVCDLWAHGAYIDSLYGSPAERPAWVRAFEENLTVMHWAADHLPPAAVLASQNPALLYLVTGHPTVSSWEPAHDRERWRQSGARYWVDVWCFPSRARRGEPPRSLVLYRSPTMNFRVLSLADAGEGFVWWWLPSPTR